MSAWLGQRYHHLDAISRESSGTGRYCSEKSMQQRIAMSSHARVEVNPSCNNFTTEQSIKPHYSNASPCHLMQSTESPIFDATFWSENGVSCPHERHQIGDSAHVVRCVGLSGMLLSFVTTLQDDYKRQSHAVRCVGFSGMLLSFVTTLRDDYKRQQQHAMRCDVLDFLGRYYLLYQLCKMIHITKDSRMRCDVLDFLGCYYLL